MLTFLKRDNINAKTHCNISGLPLNSKGVSQYNKNCLNLLNTLDQENRHKDQNTQGNKTVNTEISGDSIATDNKIDSLNLLFSHLNINSLRKEREYLEPLIRNHFGIYLVSEAKLDSSFSGSEFTIPAYRLFHKGRSQHGGGSIFFVYQDIPCKTANTSNFPNSLEVLPLEINLRDKNTCYQLL